VAKLETILIVDDSEKCIELMTLALKASGAMQVTSEREPKRAVEKIVSGRFDITLLDIKMPGMSGHQVLETVRGAKVYSPILMISGSIRENDVEGAYARGCNGYFGKPNSLSDYRSLAQAVMDYWMRGDVPIRS